MEHNNLWAPWRIDYLKSLDENNPSHESNKCFFCEYWADPDQEHAAELMRRGFLWAAEGKEIARREGLASSLYKSEAKMF